LYGKSAKWDDFQKFHSERSAWNLSATYVAIWTSFHLLTIHEENLWKVSWRSSARQIDSSSLFQISVAIPMP
jgi:hypothetical protein